MSLQSLGEDIHHRQIISIIRTKLPKVVIACLKQQKDRDEEWMVEILRKILRKTTSTLKKLPKLKYTSKRCQSLIP